jgi:UDP-glucose 4-epimerase
MKYLITGGAGFIGSNLAYYLLEQGNEVRIIDDLSSGSIDNLQNHAKDVDFTEEDILKPKLLDTMVKESDVVIHLAAKVGVRTTIENPIETFEVNVFESCHKYNVPVIFSSSSEVYGLNVNIPLTEKSLRIYKGSPSGRWIYAHSKIIAEAYLTHFARRGLRYMTLRYFNCYGPNMTTGGYSNVISNFFQESLDGKPITVFGEGTQTRCFIFIKDLVLATVSAALNNSWNLTINIGTQDEIPIINLAYKIKKLTKSKSQILFVDPNDILGDHFSETIKRMPEIKRARAVLNFYPTTSLDDGLHTTYMWIKKFPQFKKAA